MPLGRFWLDGPESKDQSMSFHSIKADAGNVLHLTEGAQSGSVAPSSARPLLPVLIILHQETSTPGRVGNALRSIGHGLDIRRRGLAICFRKRSMAMPERS